MDTKHLFQIGQRGIDTDHKPQDLDEAELSRGQNVEVSQQGGDGGIDARPGMSRINSAQIGSGSILVVEDIPASLLTDSTPYLYAGLDGSATHNWRKTSDGTTWSNDDTPTKPGFASGGLGALPFFKSTTKAASIGKKMFYTDASTPIGIHQYDGTTETTLSTVPPGVSGTLLSTPSIASEATHGTAGATTYTYKVVAVIGGSTSAASAAVSTTTGNASLTSDHYNSIEPTTPPVSGATQYDVYRTVGGGSTGKIGTIPIVSGSFTSGNGSGANKDFLNVPVISSFALAEADGSGLQYRLFTAIVARNAGASAISATSGWTSLDVHLNGSSTFPFTTVNWGSVTTADSYDVYFGYTNSWSGATPNTVIGKVTNVAALTYTFAHFPTGDAASPPSSPTNVVAAARASSYTFTDAGIAGDASTAPSSASGVVAADALAILDMISDGSQLYLAVYDAAGADPAPSGRILSFSPSTLIWAQIGSVFTSASGNGTASNLIFHQGALCYGTYTGVTSGNTSYITNTNYPLPIGLEVHATAVSFATTGMVVFNGDLYVATVSLVAGTAAIVLKRTEVATWSTARTGPATAVKNAYTSLAVFNGKLFAGWCSGPAEGTAARIESSPDGTTWTNELTLDVAEVPNQMVVFNNKLYLVTGNATQTGAVTKVWQRTTGGTWTAVDTPSDKFSGCLGIVYI